jgi:multiple sugar transport system substrate-binding protein
MKQFRHFTLSRLLLPWLCLLMVAPMASAQGGQTLTVWWNKGYYPAEDAAIKGIVGQWEQKTGNHIDLTFYSTEDLPKKLTAAVSTGSVPDVAYEDVGDFYQIPQLAWDGRLVDVSDIMKPNEGLYTKTALLTANLYNNKEGKRSYFAVPIKQQALHMFYWRPMLEKAGYTAKDIPQEWGAYWDFWEKVQDKLRAKGERVYGLGLTVSSTGTDNYYLFNQFMLAYGASLVDEHGKLHLDDKARDAATKLITFLGNTYKKGYIPPGAINWGDADNNAAFYSRQVVMTANPSLSIPAGKRTDNQIYMHDLVTTEPPPGLDGKPTPSLVAVKSAVIPEGAKQVALAKQFLGYLIQPKVLDEYLKASEGRWLPVMPTIVKDDPYWANPNDPHLPIATRQEVVGATRPWPQALNPAYASVNSEQVWGRAVGDVLINNVKPSDAVDQAFNRIKQIFSKYQIHEK